MYKRLLIIFSVCFLASCVPHKDLIYLQGKPINKKAIHKLNNEPYRLQVNDVLSINIKAKDEESVALFKKSGSVSQGFSNTDNRNRNSGIGSGNGSLENGYSIDSNGNIRLPYIGEINVLGYTTKEARVKLEKALLDYLKKEEDIFVTVNLIGIKYTILGEIVNPGTRILNQNTVNIFEVIANSGDISVTGNRKNIELWRKTPSGPKKYTIDLTQATAFNSEIFYIKPNDLIYVVPLKQKSWGTGTTGLQSLSTLVSVFTLVTSTILLIRNL